MLCSVVVVSLERFFRLCDSSSLTCQWQGRLEQSARVWLCFCVLSTQYIVGRQQAILRYSTSRAGLFLWHQTRH